jgi:hypothetical protein
VTTKMPVCSLLYQFSQPFGVPARKAFAWCTDFGPGDGLLFSQRTLRSIRRFSENALVMTDTTYPEGHPRRIRRLVRVYPSEMAWTNTHLDGPYRHSQYWYRIVSDGPRRSHLEFHGLRLESTPRALSPLDTARRAEQRCRDDSGEWRRRLAPALERDLRKR